MKSLLHSTEANSLELTKICPDTALFIMNLSKPTGWLWQRFALLVAASELRIAFKASRAFTNQMEPSAPVGKISETN